VLPDKDSLEKTFPAFAQSRAEHSDEKGSRSASK